MSMFDIAEAPVKKKKKPKTDLAVVLKASGKAANEAKEASSGEDAVTESPIISKIRHAVTKFVETNKAVKRSVVVGKVVERVFPELQDNEDPKIDNAVYASINGTIDTMIAEQDVQELRFLAGNDGAVIESLLVDADLVLDVDLPGLDEPIEGLDDEDEEDLSLEGMLTDAQADQLEDPSTWKTADGVRDPYSKELRDALNAHVTSFVVMSGKQNERFDPSNTAVNLHFNAAGALTEYGEITKAPDAYAQIYGLIPVEVQVKLDFAATEQPPVVVEPAVARTEESQTTDLEGAESDIAPPLEDGAPLVSNEGGDAEVFNKI